MTVNVVLPSRFEGRTVPYEGCILWVGRHTSLGYGLLLNKGRSVYAHRVSYEFAKGAIPDGLELDHLCRRPACVNPAHLEAVTHRENLLRGEGVSAKAARATHCPLGHPYDEANTILRFRRGGQTRECRACKRAMDARRRKA